MEQTASETRSRRSIALRLLQTRTVLNVGQTDFATKAGLAQNTYNQFERGKRRLSLEAAHALCDEYRLTLDWLFRGDLNGIPHALAKALRRIQEAAH